MRTSTTRRWRRPVLVATAIAAAVALAGCSPAVNPSGGGTASGSAGSGSSALRIAFVPFNLQIPALQGLAQGLTAAAQAQGDTVVTADPKGDPSTQLQQIQQYVQLDQIDALWVIPLAPQTIAPAIQEALDKGIVVVASGVPSDYGLTAGTPGISFSSTDNKDFGDKIGEQAAACIADRLGGKGQIIFLQSPSGASSTGEINDAVTSTLTSKSPNSTIVNQQDAADRLTSAQTVLSVLQGSPDADVVIGTDDESTLGALDAFSQAGKDLSKVCIVGAGGNDEAQQAVKDGKVYADIAFNFQADLMQNLTQLHTMAADPTAPGSQLTTPIQVITQ